jgi:hypothetical protein
MNKHHPPMKLAILAAEIALALTVMTGCSSTGSREYEARTAHVANRMDDGRFQSEYVAYFYDDGRLIHRGYQTWYR